MSVYFEVILLILTLASGLIVITDHFFFAKERKTKYAPGAKVRYPFMIDYARSLFPVFLLVLLLRSFVVDLFMVPSGSMLPTIQLGDFIWVNKYAYGLHMPVTNIKLVNNGKPQRGDVVVFRYPVDPHLNFIKRVVGLPGDVITYQHKTLTINGVIMRKSFENEETSVANNYQNVSRLKYLEQLGNVSHEIYTQEGDSEFALKWVVPPHQYFMMGDNRDDSDDSRYWGFVPESMIVGKAFMIIMSWDKANYRIRFNRIGRSLQVS